MSIVSCFSVFCIIITLPSFTLLENEVYVPMSLIQLGLWQADMFCLILLIASFVALYWLSRLNLLLLSLSISVDSF